MDQGIKKALPQSGTKGFPRAPLPSTNFQTSENLCGSLENYLEALLREPRYASCEPVARFFEKERTDSKAGIVNPLMLLGQGVNNIGKGVTGVGKGIGRSGEMATRSIATGFNQFTNTITGIPGLKRTNSGHMEGSGPPTPTKSGSNGEKSTSMQRRTSADSFNAPPGSSSRQNLTSPSTASLATSITSVKEEEEEQQQQRQVPAESESMTMADVPKITSEIGSESAKPAEESAPPPLPPRPASPGGYEVPELPSGSMMALDASAQKKLPEAVVPSIMTTDTEVEVPPGFSYTPRQKSNAPSLAEQAEEVSEGPTVTEEDVYPAAPVDAGGRMSFDELLSKDRELQKMMAKKEAEREQLNADLLPGLASASSDKTAQGQAKKAAGTTTPAQRAAVNTQATLSAMEFSSVLSFAMAILEEAYELSDSTWNLKRGILRMLETVLRTSYSAVIRAGMTKLIQSVSEEEFFVKQIDKLRESFWPPPDDV